MSKKKILLSSEWYVHSKVSPHIEYSQSVKDLLTPVIISSNNIDALRRAFVELYRKTNTIFTPHSFRYSYSVVVSGKRNVTVIPKYYLERDLNMLRDKHNISFNYTTLVPSGADWEEEVYAGIEYHHGSPDDLAFTLVKAKLKSGQYKGYTCKEAWKDRPVLEK